MIEWLPAALVALFSFGLWGLFGKLAVNYIDPKSALVFQSAGGLVLAFIALTMLDFKPSIDGKGLSLSLLTGVTYAAGCLFFFIAVDKGKAMTVVTLTALYPLITIVLSYFILRETINLKQCLGVVFALIAIYLMSS